MSAAFKAAGVVGTGHWLRHCYAMTMLAQLQRQARMTPEINPLKVVQVLLGQGLDRTFESQCAGGAALSGRLDQAARA